MESDDDGDKDDGYIQASHNEAGPSSGLRPIGRGFWSPLVARHSSPIKTSPAAQGNLQLGQKQRNGIFVAEVRDDCGAYGGELAELPSKVGEPELVAPG